MSHRVVLQTGAPTVRFALHQPGRLSRPAAARWRFLEAEGGRLGVPLDVASVLARRAQDVWP